MDKKWYLVKEIDKYKLQIINDYPKNVKLVCFKGKYTSISPTANSEEDLKRICDIPEWTCSKCNGIVSLSYTNKNKLIENKLCFNCNFWNDRINDIENRVVIDNHCYYIGPENNELDKYKGFSGILFRIKLFDSDDIIETTNLWHSGKVPEIFRNDLPDTGVFIKREREVNK